VDFYISGKEPMQLVQSAPPVLSTEEEAELQTAKDRDAFRALHLPEVRKDFRIASRHAKHRVYELTVTPTRLIRRPDSSTVHADLASRTCREAKWLDELYKENCIDGITVQTKVDKMYGAECKENLEDVFVFVVTFSVPTRVRKAALLPMRRTRAA